MGTGPGDYGNIHVHVVLREFSLQVHMQGTHLSVGNWG